MMLPGGWRMMPEDWERLERALEEQNLSAATARLLGREMSEDWRRRASTQELEALDLVDRMTNWQRQQWARAGRPLGLCDIRRFFEMRRP